MVVSRLIQINLKSVSNSSIGFKFQQEERISEINPNASLNTPSSWK